MFCSVAEAMVIDRIDVRVSSIFGRVPGQTLLLDKQAGENIK